MTAFHHPVFSTSRHTTIPLFLWPDWKARLAAKKTIPARFGLAQNALKTKLSMIILAQHQQPDSPTKKVRFFFPFVYSFLTTNTKHHPPPALLR
jgi:hypothetical protein